MLNVPVNSALVNIGLLIFWILNIYTWLLIIRVLLTWISPNPYSPVMRFLSRLADPALDLARRSFRLELGGLDFSPVILIILLQVLAGFLKDSLLYLGYGFAPPVLIPVFLKCLVGLVSSLAVIIMVLMIVRVIMSLVNPAPYNPLVMIVYALTEPLLAPLRRGIPVGPRGVDLRAVVFLAIVFLINWVLMGRLMGMVSFWIDSLGPHI